ncbi:hypothetical protein WMF27_46045 [Sorangium sp. So ce281]
MPLRVTVSGDSRARVHREQAVRPWHAGERVHREPPRAVQIAGDPADRAEQGIAVVERDEIRSEVKRDIDAWRDLLGHRHPLEEQVGYSCHKRRLSLVDEAEQPRSPAFLY